MGIAVPMSTFGRFASAHLKAEADASLVVVPVDERGVGSVVLDADNRLVTLGKERSRLAQCLNAGIYMLSIYILHGIPAGLPISLERKLFPKWIRKGRRVKGLIQSSKCFDIGTPERYRTTNEVLAEVEIVSNPAKNEEFRA
jgi:mannose-1-phosphate guanylyltransferase